MANAYVTPWTLRVNDALHGHPVRFGIGFLIGMLVVFFVGRAFVGRGASIPSDNLRVTITHLVQVAYVAFAYTYVLITARKVTQDLAPVARYAPQWQAMADRAGTHPRWALLIVGVGSYLVLGVTATNITTTETLDPWYWQAWSYDIWWQRATTVLITWWIGCLVYVTVAESTRLSRLSDAITSLDLLDLTPYQALIRQGLTNALLMIGLGSVLSLLMVESRYGPMLLAAWVSCVIFAWIGLMFPLRGIRAKIRVAKTQELDWCRQALKTARDELKSDAPAQSIAEIIAYRSVIENIRNWPFDNPTLTRFALYLLIPLVSWFGGAFVERGLDLFLS